MKRTILTILATAATIGTVAYALGRADSEPAQTASSASEAGHLDADATDDEPVLLDGAGHVHVHGPDGSLLLGAHGGLFASADDGATWSPVDFDVDVSSSDFMSLAAHPTQPDVLFAGGHGAGVVRSDDGGSTWTSSDAGIDGTDIHGLAINQRDPAYLYAYSVGHGVYSSVDGGDSWDRIDDGPDNPGVRSLAYMAVQTDMDRSMDSDNWGLLFAGTADGVHDSYSCFCGWRASSDQLGGMTTYGLATTHDDPQTSSDRRVDRPRKRRHGRRGDRTRRRPPQHRCRRQLATAELTPTTPRRTRANNRLPAPDPRLRRHDGRHGLDHDQGWSQA